MFERQSLRRSIVVAITSAFLLVALAVPASAGQIITYRGELSTGETTVVRVLRRDSGRLFLTKISFGLIVITCDGGGGDEFGIAWQSYPGWRLAKDRSFEISEGGDLVTGVLHWRDGEGTVEITYKSHGKICTSGELAWSVERTGSAPTHTRHR